MREINSNNMQVKEGEKSVWKYISIFIGFLGIIINIWIHYDTKRSTENKIVEALAERYESVDKEMFYEQALESVDKDIEKLKKENGILQSDSTLLQKENVDLQKELEKLRTQMDSAEINQKNIELAQSYASNGEYVNALALLNDVFDKTPYMEAIIRDYEEKYETQTVSKIETLITEEKYDEASDLINTAQKVIPNSEMIKKYVNKMPGEPQYLMKVCAPYQTPDSQYYREPTTFKMAGTTYTNGFSMQDGSFALINLEGRYTSLKFILGHIDETTMKDGIFDIYLDEQFTQRIEISCEELPKSYSISLNNALQLKIEKIDTTPNLQVGEWYGFADLVLQ